MWWLLVVVILVIAGAQAWVRLAPSDPSDWHVVPVGAEDVDMPNGVQRVVPGTEEALFRLDRIIRKSPRTHVLAGSPRAGLVTYVTRSLVWGFPDYTTVSQGDERIVIFARSRFGGSDFDVNKRRVEGWLSQFRLAG